MNFSNYQLGLSDEIIVDSFAGGGGASTGIEAALGHPVHVAINHDPEAVAMHKLNHPYTEHYCEDVWEVNPRDVQPGRQIGLLWASPDCKHFSKAKGGAPVSKRVRGLAWVVVRWAATRQPRIIALENVEEFTTWGPLIESAQGEMKPDPSRKGQTFRAFTRALERLGYRVEWRELRACDFGAPTSRKRLFLLARRDGRPIVWPAPTHGRKGTGLKPYRTAAEIIDWSIPCPSIFSRPRPLADNTLRRIARGLQKYVINNPKPFIVEMANSGNGARANGVEEPLRTVTAFPKGGSFAVVDPFIVKVNHTAEGYDQFRGQSAHEPLQTVTAKHGYALAAPVIERSFGKSEGNSATSPLGTITAGGGGKAALVSAFLAKHYGGVTGHGVERPIGTVTTADHHSLVTAFMTKHRGDSPGSGMTEPVPTITAGGAPDQKHVGGNGHALGVAAVSVLKMRGENIGSSADEPLHTITAGGNHYAEVRAFLIKYFGTDQDPQLGESLHTITTKDRFGLVTVAGEDYQIVDIGMRMLTPRELFNAQGFPPDYIIDRTAEGKTLPKHAQTRMCGNSVSPVMAAAIISANMLASPLFDTPANDNAGDVADAA